MINYEDVLNIHEFLINKFGSTHGMRDQSLLQSALSRPFQTFDQAELYKSHVEKSAAQIECIVTIHPFIDGNKRTGYVLMRLYLLENNLDILADQDEKYEFSIAIASGKKSFDQIAEWIQSHLAP